MVIKHIGEKKERQYLVNELRKIRYGLVRLSTLDDPLLQQVEAALASGTLPVMRAALEAFEELQEEEQGEVMMISFLGLPFY